MSDGPLLLRAVLAHPAEDAPRAAFADWCQDQPDDHLQWYGRFVAQQLRGEPWESLLLRDTLVGQASLYFPHYGVRVHHCPNVFAGGVVHWGAASDPVSGAIFEVNRGFVFRAELTCSDFLKCAGPLFARHPIESVQLTDKRPTDDTSTNPQLYRVYVKSKPETAPMGRVEEWCFPNDFAGLFDGHREDLYPAARLPDGTGSFIYDSLPAVNSAILRACLAYGRRAAESYLLASLP